VRLMDGAGEGGEAVEGRLDDGAATGEERAVGARLLRLPVDDAAFDRRDAAELLGKQQQHLDAGHDLGFAEGLDVARLVVEVLLHGRGEVLDEVAEVLLGGLVFEVAWTPCAHVRLRCWLQGDTAQI
jgi:hypothetical protein